MFLEGLVQWLSAGSLRWWGLGLGSASDGGRFGKRNVVGFGCGPITSRYGEMEGKKWTQINTDKVNEHVGVLV